jgi:hypothetical protein
MKKSFFLIIIMSLTMMACQKNEYGLSDCLDNEIENFKNGDYACSEDANVKEYQFKGEKVYVFDPGTCGADMTSEVIDEDCNSLGYLGGIAGVVEIDGTNFSEAEFVKIIWER